MSFPLGFPLYPSSNFKMYNVSLGIPGPFIYDIPSIGDFIEKLEYPNSKVSVLFPDMEYITKFANYEIGISDFMLKSSLDQNLTKIPSSSSDIKDHFENTFSSNTQESMGLKALEKTILSSMFESQKPYFEIAQFVIESMAFVEDNIARISPLFGASIVGPDSALSVKSRKPVGNGPINNSDSNKFGIYGSPVSIGYNNGDEIKSKLNSFKTISKKGGSIEIDEDGKPTFISPIKTNTNGNYGYATVSTIFSTGQFDPNVDYLYKYIDIDEDIEPSPDPIINDGIDDDNRPDRIIIGIFDVDGNLINPKDKIKYWDVDASGNLIKSESIFEKASWIYQTDKWIFDKSVNQFSWKILQSELFHWRKWGDTIIQFNSPGDGWEKIKYKDVINFDSEENRIYKFKENDYITTFSEDTINEYINYYDDSANLEISKSDLSINDENELINQLKEVYNKDSILNQLQSLVSLSKLKLSYYSGIENGDWDRYQFGRIKLPAPSGTFSEFNSSLRKSFKPMKFNIGGKDIWIDPETDYDYKIIRVDSSPNIQFRDSPGISPGKDVIKNSYIQEFVKNRLKIIVLDSSGVEPRPFSIEMFKNNELIESINDNLEFNLTNWNLEFDNSDYIRRDENEYRFIIFLQANNPPSFINNIISSQGPRELIISSPNGVNTYSSPRPDYENTIGSKKENWPVFSSTSTGDEIISNRIVKSGGDYYYGNSLYKYYLDVRNNPELISQAEILEALGGSDNLAEAADLRNKSKEVFKRYEIEGSSRTGIFDLMPTQSLRFRPIKVDVKDNKILRWIIFDESISKISSFKGSNILPNLFKLNQLSFNLSSTQINFDKSGNLDDISISDLGKFQVKIEGKSKFIDSTNITNDKLITNDLYSMGRYGLGYRGDSSTPDNPVSIGYLIRNQLTELDVETYYIIEAVKEEKNPISQTESQNSSSSSGGGFYQLPHALGIIPSTIKMVSSIFTKLIPAIKKLINLIKNPSSFLIEIIKSKTEDHFSIFKPESFQILGELPQISSLVKSLVGDSKSTALSSMRKKVKDSELGNFIYVDDEGGYRFLLDGSALIEFFGIMFGIKLDLTKNNPPIKPIFSLVSNNLDFLIKSFKIEKNDTGDLINGVFSSKENIDNYTFNKSSDGDEEISIQYSTGKFIEGVDYKFIYVNQEISKIITEADEESLSGDLEGLESSIGKYEIAYNLINSSDPTNLSLKEEILNKIKKSKEKINMVSQPIFKFLLGIVSLPIKIIFEIIKWLVDFFKKLTDPTKIPSLIGEFLSFDWIMKFFTPKGIFEMAGIKFNPEKVAQWCIQSNAKKSGTNEYLMDDDFPLADLNQFLSVAFQANLPIYTAKQYRDMCLKPFRQFSPFLCLLERIINGFIMLVWSIMGISAIIPPPLLKLCNKINENININDFNSILSGVFDDINRGGNGGTNDEYSFVYEVKLPNGGIQRSLDRDSIQKFINDNEGLNFDFLNFETIE